jgi:hypothetical protein
MLSNPKTSIPGILILVASLATLAAHALQGTIGATDLGSVIAALTGLGLIAAKDGGK